MKRKNEICSLESRSSFIALLDGHTFVPDILRGTDELKFCTKYSVHSCVSDFKLQRTFVSSTDFHSTIWKLRSSETHIYGEQGTV